MKNDNKVSHVCTEDHSCICSMQALEPDEKCPKHGGGSYLARCGKCGRFVNRHKNDNQFFTLSYKTDILTCNGYIYPKEEIRKALDNYLDTIKENKALGEFIPRSFYNRADYTTIDSANVSHMIVGYGENLEGFDIIFKILDTDAGKTLKNSIKEGLRVGPRVEAKTDGNNIVYDMKIIAIDLLGKENCNEK